MRDPTSIHQVEYNQERHTESMLGLCIHAHMHTHIHRTLIHTCAYSTHTYTHTHIRMRVHTQENSHTHLHIAHTHTYTESYHEGMNSPQVCQEEYLPKDIHMLHPRCSEKARLIP